MMENKFTPRAEESLRLAQEAAEEMGHGYGGSEHLLLGLMREEEGIAHRVLEEAGLTDGGNVTGTSDELPVAQQLATIRAMLPEAKNIGILDTVGEANSLVQLESYKELAGD